MAQRRRGRRRNITAERKIYFYRIDAGQNEAGRPVTFDPRPVLQHISSLPFSPEGAYMVEANNDATSCWVDDHNGPMCQLRFGVIRRSGLPQQETSGRLRDLNIPDNSGLAELVHVVFFSNNIVGSEFNFHGPRLSRLGTYLHLKGGGHCPLISFNPLLRQNVTDQLAQLSDIRFFRLRIHASYADTIKRANRDLGNMFQTAARAGAAEEVEIILRPRPYSRQPLSDNLSRLIGRLTRRQDLYTEASNFEVRGLSSDTGRVEKFDILQDKLIAQKQIIRQGQKSRALDASSAYSSIIEAYNELQDQLTAAAAVQV